MSLASPFLVRLRKGANVGLASIGETKLIELGEPQLTSISTLVQIEARVLDQHKICSTFQGCKKATPVIIMVAEGKGSHQGIKDLRRGLEDGGLAWAYATESAGNTCR
jgi:hypothetical protein